MRVGLDLLFLIPGETGGRETYARELIPALQELSGELELTVFLNRDAGPLLAKELGLGLRTVTVPVSARSRAQWAVGELTLLSIAARRAGVQLLHSMANFAPAWGAFRRVVTIHDLQYQAVPELLSPPNRAATHTLMWLAAHRTGRVIAVSSAGRKEIVSGLGIPPERIDVVPNGVRPAPLPSAAASTIRSELFERLHPGERALVLAVATNLPHKNLPRLFKALALWDPGSRPLLVIAGHGTDEPALATAAEEEGVSADVRLLGGVSADELESLYALARCLVLPSLHEGFGLPVLEAMARSVPVACSDIAALREVGGEAALYFDPRRPEEVGARISKLLADPDLADRLREMGRARAARYSWRAAAEGTFECYRRALALPVSRP